MAGPAPDKGLAIFVSASALVFYALMLSVPRGYALGASGMLLCSFYALTRARIPQLDRQDKTLMCLLALIFAAGLLSTLYHSNPVRSLDLPSRYVLAIPVLLLVLHTPPRLPWVWGGLILGTLTGAGIAYWQLYIMTAPRAIGFTGVIQFGDLALMMGVFCLAGQFWAATLTRHKRGWQIALWIGALAGAYGSLASGARGGWVATPVILVLFCAALVTQRNLIRGLIAGTVAAVALTIVAVTVPTVETRYEAMVSDIQKYKQGDADTSLGARFATWSALSIMIPEKPLLGWSMKEFNERLDQLVAEGRAHPIVTRLANTHNNYLELWVLHGLPALLSTIALMLFSFVAFCRRLRSTDGHVQALAVAGASLVSAYGIFCMSQIMLGRNNTLLFFVLSLVILWGCMRRREAAPPGHLPRSLPTA